MDSKLGLIVQLNGVFLITILSIFLRRSLKLRALKYWTTAWLCLSFALISLRMGFEYEQLKTLLFTYYFLGEYIFGFMLIAGCKSLAEKNYELKAKTEFFLLPFVGIALLLPNFSADFNEIYTIHSLVMAGFFGYAFVVVRGLGLPSFGSKLMNVALVLLSLNFFIYFVVFAIRIFVAFDTTLLSYNSIVDLVLETTLGFGMVIVLLETVLRDYKDANTELTKAKHKLEELVRTDPLTTAFNRHAFYGFVNGHTETGTSINGCVGFFDIDDLKGINDCFGHAAGDLAIRSVVRAIREIIRAEDLIYRWGGDEFFVIMIGLEAEMAELRMGMLDNLLREIKIRDNDEPIAIGVSWGFRDFADADQLDDAIKQADSDMYARKHGKKRKKRLQHIGLEAMVSDFPLPQRS